MLFYRIWKAKEDIGEDNFDCVLIKKYFCDHSPKDAKRKNILKHNKLLHIET